jgi:CheY-like chemotaxis protein
MLANAQEYLNESSIFAHMEKAKMLDGSVKLLIVDGDVSIRKYFALLFSELGYCVRSVKDGISALSEIRHDFPDILLSELNMAGMSGVEFLVAIRHLFPSIRVVAMSGTSSGNCMSHRFAADAFFEKGADAADMIKFVDDMTQLERTLSRRRNMEFPMGFPVARAVSMSSIATVPLSAG